MGIFTGLIMEVGTVRRIDRRADGAYLTIEANLVLAGTQIGDSIAINGVDLTATSLDSHAFAADASLETLARSTLGNLSAGSRVNLERALAVGERLGGHMVQGHVDGTGRLRSTTREGNAYRVRFEFPDELGRYIAMKGSIAIDGISLTVAALGPDWFEVVIIPHTWTHTTVGALRAGDRVNLEGDVLAKYVERLLEATRAGPQPAGASSGRITVEYLAERGF
jgi:riboflavin synthase